MTRMQSSSRAPVLSATRTRVSCWIIGMPPFSLLGGLDDLGGPPALRLRARSRLDDADDVSGLGGVLLVVGVELRRAPDHLLVARVHLQRVDADDDRLLHRARDDDAAPLLRAAALAFRLGESGDRLSRLRLLARGLGSLAALRARYALSLPPSLHRGLGGSGFRFGLRLGCRLDRHLLGLGFDDRLELRLRGRLRLGLGDRLDRLLRDRSLGGLLPGPLRLLRRRLRGGSLYRRLRLGLFLGLLLLTLSHLSPFQTRFPLLPDGQDAGDLAFRQAQSRRVLQRAGRRLEAQVEEL